MTRWKRELNDWAVERGMHAVFIPRDISHDSWRASKVMMALVKQQMDDPAHKKSFDDALTNLMLYGTTMPEMFG